MIGRLPQSVVVTAALLLVTQCRAEIDFSLVTLPDWRSSSEYVTQCFYDRRYNLICDWKQHTEDTVVTVLESGPLRLEGEACLEFWYLSSAATNGSELSALLRSSAGLTELWSSSALHADAWRQVFVPLDIVDPGTQVIIKAVSTEGRVTLNRIGVRRGSCGAQCDSGSELWTDGSSRCLCPGGRLSCSPSQCPEGQVCGPQRGTPSGTAASGTCTIHSHTDCSTFDGEVFRFVAPCTYTLAKPCSASEAMPVFSVEVVNEQDGNASLPTVQQVVVEMGGYRVSLMKRQTHRIVVNGVWRKLPLTLGNGTVTIKSNPAAVELASSFGLSVSYDNAGAVQVVLPAAYSDKVCGLCGNFNHFRNDHFGKPDGSAGGNATAPAESWQSGPAASSSSCETVLVPHQCDPLEMAEYSSEPFCGGLLSAAGPFADCLSALGAESYFRGCVVDMCSSHGDPAVLCEALGLYADICQEAGVSVPMWRNATFCPLQCGANSHYNSCADGCPEVCSTLDVIGSCGSCEERCECDSGWKLSGGRCVPAEDCGCWYDGEHYEKGASFLEGECEQTCQCTGNGAMRCAAMRCEDQEVCKVQDGAKGCFPFRPATCSVYGDPHYITYDGMAYDFQGGCSYTLTTTCGGESSVQFSVIGHNVHPTHQNSTRAKLEAVSLLVEDLHLTLNQSGEVDVNVSAVKLPYSTSGTYGTVKVYLEENYIVLETTFGLRMTIDTQNRLFLQVDERYRYELCGLCGTYSDRQDDDFVAPGGQNATGPFEFGHSWKVPGDNECVSHPEDPKVCDSSEENEAYNECYTLMGDAFKPCHELIHPSIYLKSCVYDYCATGGDQHTLCESLKAYAAACQVAGVELPHWQTDTACADPQTTTTLPTHPTSPSPTTDQTLCPITCDFEKNLCGWEQLVQDSFDWTRHSGPTPSLLTGPTGDHTTGAGFYMYIEGTSVTHGDSARLWSSMCHFTGPLCLHFWYHVYGSASAMALNIYLLKDNKATKLWAKINNQGPEWSPAIIDIKVSGPFQIIIEGIRGSNAHSDVAIDDISIHYGSCSGRFPNLVSGTLSPSTAVAARPSPPVCNMDCSFDSSLCSWSQMVTDAFDWTRRSGSTPTLMTGPSAGHTAEGHYLYIEASDASHGDTARLISSECSDSGPQCLRFWFHMYGSADTMGLHVYLLQDRLAEAVWWKRNDQGNMWQLGQVEITTTAAFQIIFEGRRGSNNQSDVAIDDVKLYRGHCSEPTAAAPDVVSVTARLPLTAQSTDAPESPVVSVTARLPLTAQSTDAPESPVVSVTARLPLTAQSTAAGVSSPPTGEAQTSVIHEGDVTADPHVGPPAHPICQVDCNFDEDLCEWNQLVTDVFDWTRHRGSTPTLTGPSSDHTTGDGHYLYIEASDASHGDTARLISSECSDSGPQCLRFWFHMYGSADTMGLHVYLLQDRRAQPVWRRRNNQEDAWHLAQVDLTTTGAFQIIFEGRRGSNDQSDVAIDDVSLRRGPCSAATVAPEFPPVNTSTATQTTTRPQQPITTTTTTTTTTTITAGPQPPTSGPPGVQTPEQPEPESTDEPQTTRRPEPTATSTSGAPTSISHETTAGSQPTVSVQPSTDIQPEPQTTSTPPPPPTATPPPTTATPPPPTTATPPPPTTATPPPPTTATPPPPTTATPPPPTTVTPPPPTTATPPPPTTVTPPPPTTSTPLPPTTSTPPPPPTATPPPPTTSTPPPPTTATPPPPTTSTPPPPTTATPPPPPTTVTPPPPTTATPPPPPTATPPPPTTAQPHPPTTVTPPPPTTATPPPPPTATPPPPTTAQPHPPTTVTPPPPTTSTPLPPTTATPPPPTTATPPPPTTAQPPPPTTATPPPPTTATPPPPTTATPPPPTTATPPPPTTATPPPPTTATPPPPTTATPPPPTTATPPPPTTATPPPPTTATPPPPTTATPPPPTTATPPPPTTAQPPPPTTATPPPPTTATPPPPTTTQPQPPTTVKHPPTAPSPQPTTTSGPQPSTTNRPPVTTERPPVTTERPPVTTERPPVTTERPPVTTERPPVTTERPPVTTERPHVTTERPPVTTERPPVTTERPPVTTERPPVTTERPPVTTERPHVTTERPHVTTERPPVTTERPPVTTERPPVTTERPLPPTTATTQHPTSHLPTPSCPANSHYRPCAPPCSPTCRHLNGPPGCTHDQRCEGGCVCDHGFVDTWRGCVPVQRCGCVDRNGTGRDFREVWYTEHCRQKCECEKRRGEGRIDCDDKDECDGNAVCLRNVEREYYCQSTGFSECSVRGDPEYRTFDRMKHDFAGEHSYVLVRTSGLPDYLPPVYIEAINDDDEDDEDDDDDDSHHHGDSSSSEEHRRRRGSEEDEDEDKDGDDSDSRQHRRSSEEEEDDDSDSRQHRHSSEEEEDDHRGLRELKIRVYNHTVLLRRHGKLVVDGRKTRTPTSPAAGLSIREHSSRIYLKTDFGLSVEFDGHGRAEIILPNLYKRKVGGLCGNFDGHRVNDWTKPDGTRARSLQEFGDSWRV